MSLTAQPRQPNERMHMIVASEKKIMSDSATNNAASNHPQTQSVRVRYVLKGKLMFCNGFMEFIQTNRRTLQPHASYVTSSETFTLYVGKRGKNRFEKPSSQTASLEAFL